MWCNNMDIIHVKYSLIQFLLFWQQNISPSSKSVLMKKSLACSHRWAWGWSVRCTLSPSCLYKICSFTVASILPGPQPIRSKVKLICKPLLLLSSSYLFCRLKRPDFKLLGSKKVSLRELTRDISSKTECSHQLQNTDELVWKESSNCGEQCLC